MQAECTFHTRGRSRAKSVSSFMHISYAHFMKCAYEIRVSASSYDELADELHCRHTHHGATRELNITARRFARAWSSDQKPGLRSESRAAVCIPPRLHRLTFLDVN
eukprot:2219439-Pleurochrysis_carterae.AAC.3